MALNYWNTIFYSAVGEPNDFGSADAGQYNIINQGGNPVGWIFNDFYLFVFQEAWQTIFQHQTGDSPLMKVGTKAIGANSPLAICKDGNNVYYLDNYGNIRVTTGYTDEIISNKIKYFTSRIINNRSIKDYYSSDGINCIPSMFLDDQNRCLRLYYAGESTYNDKCINYFIDAGLFTIHTGVDVSRAISASPYYNYIGVIGNASGTGYTYYMEKILQATDKISIWDTGWIASVNESRIRVTKLEMWIHPQYGASISDNTNCTITVEVFTDPSSTTASFTNTIDVVYDGNKDSIQHLHLQLGGAQGIQEQFVRVVATDSGTNTNYSIESIMIDVEDVKFDIE